MVAEITKLKWTTEPINNKVGSKNMLSWLKTSSVDRTWIPHEE